MTKYGISLSEYGLNMTDFVITHLDLDVLKCTEKSSEFFLFRQSFLITFHEWLKGGSMRGLFRDALVHSFDFSLKALLSFTQSQSN